MAMTALCMALSLTACSGAKNRETQTGTQAEAQTETQTKTQAETAAEAVSTESSLAQSGAEDLTGHTLMIYCGPGPWGNSVLP